jgi:hypothetical protein
VTHTATCPALSFDIEPSALVNLTLLRPIQAARQTSRRAASISSFMLASVNAIAWLEMIGRPNCSRCFA